MLCAPSQSSSGCSLRRSSLPGMLSASAAAGSTCSPRYASAAATASAEVRARQHVDARGAERARVRRPLGLAEHDDRAGPDHRELLGRDRLTRRAEDVGVVERDVRQHDDRRVEHVRRVVAPAEPRLDHGHVDLARRELGQRGRREHLELRRALRVRANARERALEVGVLAVDLDPLGPAAHVRRDVRADAQAGGAEQRRAHERGRGLAVRADDVDRREPRLRLSERGEQRAHAAEAELLRPGRERLEPGDVGVAEVGGGHSGEVWRCRAASARPARRSPCRASVRHCGESSQTCHKGHLAAAHPGIRLDANGVGGGFPEKVRRRRRRRSGPIGPPGPREPGSAATRRAPRGRGGSARASRARPRPAPAARSTTKRSFASMPSARAISLRSRSRSASTSPFAFTRSGLTTASKIRFSSPSSATSTPLRRNVTAARCTSSSARASPGVESGSGHGRDDQARVVELRPDLLGHVRHDGMEQREQPLERAVRRRDRGLLAGVEPRLDRLRVPVAEVVEDQVVERVDDLRELERRRRQRLLDQRARLVDPPQDPALLERLRLDAAERHVRARAEDEARDVPELVRELRALLDVPPREARVLRRRQLQQAVARRVGAVLVHGLERVDARCRATSTCAGRRPPSRSR